MPPTPTLDRDDDDTEVNIAPGSMERLDVLILDADGSLVGGGNIMVNSRWLDEHLGQRRLAPMEACWGDGDGDDGPASLCISPPGVRLAARKAPRQ